MFYKELKTYLKTAKVVPCFTEQDYLEGFTVAQEYVKTALEQENKEERKELTNENIVEETFQCSNFIYVIEAIIKKHGKNGMYKRGFVDYCIIVEEFLAKRLEHLREVIKLAKLDFDNTIYYN